MHLLDIKSGEERTVTLLLIHSFFSGLSFVLLDAASSALFLAEKSADDLPYVYLLAAVVAVILGSVFTALERRMRIGRLLMLFAIFLVLALLGFAVTLLVFTSDVLLFGVLAWREAHFVLASVQFGALTGLLFDLRQSKRLLGLVASGEIVAGILGGLGVTFIVSHVGARETLFIAVAAQFGALVVLALIIETAHPLFATPKHDAHTMHVTGPEGPTTIENTSYTRYLYAGSIFSFFLFYFVDFAFYAGVASVYPNEAELMTFFGLFFAGLGLTKLAANTFVSGPALTKLGITFGLLTLPTVLVIGTATTLVAVVWSAAPVTIAWLLVATKLADEVVRRAIQTPTFRVLCQPLHPHIRMRIQSIRESIVEPVAIGIAALCLMVIATQHAQTLVSASVVVMLLGMGWLWMARKQADSYRDALAHAMNHRQLVGAELHITDSASLSIVETFLASGRVPDVIFCLSLLEKSNVHSHKDILRRQLSHPHSDVRKYVLAIVERHQLHMDEELQRLIDNDACGDVRAGAIQALCSCRTDAVVERVSSYLDDADVQVMVGTLIGLLRYGGFDGVLAAGAKLKELHHADDPERRRAVALMLERANIKHFYWPLASVWNDQRHEGEASIEAAGSLAQSALSFLIKIGAPAIETIVWHLNDPAMPIHVQLRLMRTIGRIGGDASTAVLKWFVTHPNPEVRDQATDVYIDTCAPLELGRRNFVDQVIDDELASAVELAAILAGLSAENLETRLATALWHDIRDTARRVLRLLMLIVRRREFHHAVHQIQRNAHNAAALEVIDVNVPSRIRVRLLPMLESPDPGELLQQLSIRKQRTMEPLLSRSNLSCSPWTVACALDLQTAWGLPVTLANVKALVDSGRGILQEQAVRNYLTCSIDQEQAGEDIRKIGGLEAFVTPQTLVTLGFMKGDHAMAMPIVEKVLALKTVEIFGSVPEKWLVPLAERSIERLYHSGDSIIRKGDIGQSMFIIVEGRVRVHIGQQEITVLNAPTVVGELAVFDPDPRSADITAVNETIAFELDAESLYTVMAEHSQMTRDVVRFLCQRLRSTTNNQVRSNAREARLRRHQDTVFYYNQPTFAEEVAHAEARLIGRIATTRQIDVPVPAGLGNLSDKCRLILKLENEQLSGSCKLRSAYMNILSLLDQKNPQSIITVSTGNNGIATAYICRELSLPCTVFVPENASSIKIEKMRSMGATVELYGTDIVDTEIMGRKYAAEHALDFLSPYNSWEAIYAQATIGVEIGDVLNMQRITPVSAIIPVGGGGLISGVGGQLKVMFPSITIIGVWPKNSAVLLDSLVASEIIHYASLPTLSDATAGGIEQGSITFETCRQVIDEFIAVSEDQIGRAMAWLYNECEVQVEGSGALAVAALENLPASLCDGPLIMLACGSNISSLEQAEVLRRYGISELRPTRPECASQDRRPLAGVV